MSMLFLLALSVVCDVTGQLAFKKGADTLPRPANLGVFLVALFRAPWLLLGIAIYCAEFAIWIRVLMIAPLGIAFPLASLNIIGIMLASHLVLGEPINRRQYAGAVLVMAGIALVAGSLWDPTWPSLIAAS
ncbi:membrane protein [Azorhizobium oxalatiphilum]|uniref:Membrane protein n=1 Tax=Azorhizobium oxalatiphilum TaxID=980631 RepID=A0A917BLM9_9HYPH|nr:EamA family transporter [Azorhizobium oxalatiphilum]GGF50621.1 membrane protein [Azorhizobium oxalatiphilum]